MFSVSIYSHSHASWSRCTASTKPRRPPGATPCHGAKRNATGGILRHESQNHKCNRSRLLRCPRDAVGSPFDPALRPAPLPRRREDGTWHTATQHPSGQDRNLSTLLLKVKIPPGTPNPTALSEVSLLRRVRKLPPVYMHNPLPSNLSTSLLFCWYKRWVLALNTVIPL